MVQFLEMSFGGSEAPGRASCSVLELLDVQDPSMLDLRALNLLSYLAIFREATCLSKRVVLLNAYLKCHQDPIHLFTLFVNTPSSSHLALSHEGLKVALLVLLRFLKVLPMPMPYEAVHRNLGLVCVKSRQ